MAKHKADFIAELESPEGVLISPDGRLVVYTLHLQWNRKHEHSTSSLWLADVGKQHSARQLTSGKFHDAGPRFSPGGEYISFISDRDSKGISSNIYLLPIVKGGEALPLIPAKNQKSIGSHLWSPDGRYVAYTSADEDEQEDQGKCDAKTYGENCEHARLRIFDTHTKRIRTLVSEEAHVANFAWSPDGEYLVYTICKSRELDHVRLGAELRTVHIKDSTTHHVCRFDGAIEDLEWHGEQLFWIAKQDNRLLQASMALWRAPALVPSQHAERVAYGDHNCARGIRRCGDRLVVYVQDGLSDRLEWFGYDKAVIFADNLNISWGWDARFDGKNTTVAAIKGHIPSYAEVFTVIAGNIVQLSQHCTPPDHLTHTDCVTIETKADDGTPVDGVVYIPQSLSLKAGPHPTVVVVHGGPYDRVTRGRDPIFSWTPWLLSLGYVVLHPNYRGGSGHGRKFAAATWGDPSASYQDVITLLKKCIADGIVDQKRVAISGWSQGGYLSYLAVTRDDNFHFAAAIAGAGVSCWDTLAMSTDVPMIETALSGSAPWLSSGESTTTSSSRRASPIWCMQNISTPVLILHGEEDARVPVSQALGFHRGMLARGKPCEMVLYPREGHGFPKPFERAHYLHMLEKIGDFLEKHLNG